MTKSSTTLLAASSLWPVPTSTSSAPSFGHLLECDTGYCYHGVQRWGQLTRQGIFTFHELYLPINFGSQHWIFARIRFKQNMIEVWNSSGRQSVNISYLTHALHYLYDELSTSSSRTLPNFQTWRQSWTLEDRSDDSPRQGNGYDCGVFTLVSIALLAQGEKLNKESYNQTIIYGIATRRRIA